MLTKRFHQKFYLRVLNIGLIVLAGALLIADFASAQKPFSQPKDQPLYNPYDIGHTAAMGKNETDTCFACHIDLEDEHAITAHDYEESIHKAAGVSCSACHGGDPTKDEMKTSMDVESGFIGVPNKKEISGICASCHSDADRMRQYNLPTDQYSKYSSSVHGIKLRRGDNKVPTCTDCHGTHNILKASDPRSPVYMLNIPELCANCHGDSDLMESYDIPTNQLEVYKESIHGKALLLIQFAPKDG